MNDEVLIEPLTEQERGAVYRLYEESVPEAFVKDGAGAMKYLIKSVIAHKKAMVDQSLDETDPDTFFLTAKIRGEVIGAISFGPPSEDIIKCSKGELKDVGELGSLFILPAHQGKGIATRLIQALMVQLDQAGIEAFCLYSGFKQAQAVWRGKFGAPLIVKENYWGPGADNMIWLGRTRDYL